MTPDEERAAAVTLATASRDRIRAAYDFLVGETMQGVASSLSDLAAGLGDAPGPEPTVKALLGGFSASLDATAQQVRSQIVALDSFISPPDPAPTE